MKKILDFLKSNESVLIATIMSLATQLWHSVKAFVILDVGGTENKWNYLFGILFSISTSFAILLFTVRGKKNLAYFFLTVEVFINIIHYSVMGMSGGPILYATLFMCLIVPVTISIYSAEINPDEEAEQKFTNPVQDQKHEFEWGIKPELSKAVIDKMPEGSISNTMGVNDDEFIKDVSELVGYDVMTEGKKRINAATRDELRKAWKDRKNKSKMALRRELESILSKEKSQFFN